MSVVADQELEVELAAGPMFVFPPSPDQSQHSESSGEPSGSDQEMADDTDTDSTDDPDPLIIEPNVPHATLAEIVLAQFNRPSNSDCIFQLKLREGPCRFFLHSICLAESRRLREAVVRVPGMKLDEFGRIVLDMHTDLHFLNSTAINGALQTLYGRSPKTVMDKILENQRSMPIGLKVVTHRMSMIFTYYTTGFYLEIIPVMEAAVEACLAELLLENLEYSLAFALHGAQNFSDHDPYDEEFESKILDGTYLRLGPPNYGHETGKMIHGCLKYLARQFPRFLQFDPNAPISYFLGAFKLPTDGPPSNIHPPRESMVNPSTVATDISALRDKCYTRISTLLISLPYPALQEIHQRLRWRGNDFDMLPVIGARNKRSLAMLRHVAQTYHIQAPNEVDSQIQNIPEVLFRHAAVPDRARWVEELVVTDKLVGFNRCWLGPIPDGQATSSTSGPTSDCVSHMPIGKEVDN